MKFLQTRKGNTLIGIEFGDYMIILLNSINSGDYKCRTKKEVVTNSYLTEVRKIKSITERGQPDCRACFCLNLFRTSVASNPALSHNCRGITCNIRGTYLITWSHQKSKVFINKTSR